MDKNTSLVVTARPAVGNRPGPLSVIVRTDHDQNHSVVQGTGRRASGRATIPSVSDPLKDPRPPPPCTAVVRIDTWQTLVPPPCAALERVCVPLTSGSKA